jgi:hypothetical protein
MEKTTVLANLRLTMRFNEATVQWLRRFSDSWVSKEDGSVFLSEYGRSWEALFLDAAKHEAQAYFAERGLPQERLPFIQVGERYRGSFIIDAYLVMAATVSTTYAVLKAISELPQLAEGLSTVKAAVQKRLDPVLNRAVRHQLIQTLNLSEPSGPRPRFPERQTEPPLPPPTVVETDFMLDARPLASLTPVVKTHKVHLSVGISRDAFTLENLGDQPLRNVRLGLFRTETERNQWSYADSYMAGCNLLSAGQTTSKELREFRDRQGNLMDMSDGEAAYVDSWVQDDHGIYLFRFFLEAE